MTGEQRAFPPARVYPGPQASLLTANMQLGLDIRAEITLALRSPIRQHWLMIDNVTRTAIQANLQAGETSTEIRIP